MRLFVKTPHRSCAFSLVVGLLVSLPGHSEAAIYFPQSLGGEVSYEYGYVTTETAQSENTGLSASINSSGYFLQPWFITSNLGLTIGLSRTAANSGTNTSSVATGGNLDLEVFPESRFPFSFMLDRTDSRLSYTNTLNLSSSNQYTNTRLYVRQSYIGQGNVLADLAWIHNHGVTAYDDSTSDTAVGNLSMSKKANSLHVNTSYTTSSSANSSTKPENFNFTMDHRYAPDPQLGVNSNLGYIENKSTSNTISTDSKNTQASSYFSWRPDHRPYTLSGGLRLSTSTSGSSNATTESKTQQANISLGTSYQITPHFSFTGSGGVGATDANSSQSTFSTETAGLDYYSDQYLISGFNYSWNLSGAVNNSSNKNDTNTEDRQSLNLNFGHRATRDWMLGQDVSFSLGLSQSVNGSKVRQSGGQTTTTGDGSTSDTIWGISHALNSGMNFRGYRGATYLSLNAVDSRSHSSSTDTDLQTVTGMVSRNYLINRLSSMQGSINAQVSKQAATNTETSTTKSAYASGSYSHSRAFGVYNLMFNSNLSYQRNYAQNNDVIDNIDWENRFNYRIGLLSMSLNIRVTKYTGVTPTTSLYFRATRSF